MGSSRALERVSSQFSLYFFFPLLNKRRRLLTLTSLATRRPNCTPCHPLVYAPVSLSRRPQKHPSCLATRTSLPIRTNPQRGRSRAQRTLLPTETVVCRVRGSRTQGAICGFYLFGTRNARARSRCVRIRIRMCGSMSTSRVALFGTRTPICFLLRPCLTCMN